MYRTSRLGFHTSLQSDFPHLFDQFFKASFTATVAKSVLQTTVLPRVSLVNFLWVMGSCLDEIIHALFVYYLQVDDIRSKSEFSIEQQHLLPAAYRRPHLDIPRCIIWNITTFPIFTYQAYLSSLFPSLDYWQHHPFSSLAKNWGRVFYFFLLTLASHTQ